jgi:3-phenylpropionate/cinnamic acid dioxygenase small subunit
MTLNEASRQATMLEIQAFQAREIMLLQSRRYEDWLKLFTTDLHYWVPVSSVNDAGETAAQNELAHFDDTLETLTMRVRRAMSRFAWTEHPPSQVRYFVMPLSLEDDRSTGKVQVQSNFLVSQTRLQREQNLFVGTRQDTLQRVDGDFRIAARKVDLDRVVLGAKNITVFF